MSHTDNSDDTQTRALTQVHATADANETNTSKVLQKLFKRKKNQKLRKLEDVDGPLYIDPQINDKLENPRKCMHKNAGFRLSIYLSFCLISFCS